MSMQDKIITSLLTAFLTASYTITVNDGYDDVLKYSTDPESIQAAMGSTETDVLRVYQVNEYIGFILLIPGNGDDIVTDHSANDIITNIVDKVLEDLGVL